MIVGCTLFYIAAGILTPGSIAMGIMLAKIEGRWPLWSLTMAVCGVFISLIVFFIACAWLVAAYRPDTAGLAQLNLGERHLGCRDAPKIDRTRRPTLTSLRRVGRACQSSVHKPS